ncbi:Gfo/Idh/MocA family oxidoreductase [Mesobacillus foraminis]|uniref:Gfo/Idh/MocA family protein n=1 Tax=Mesobacillus foraminis TaxID=279826 RepID=UPI0039A352FE
MKADKVKIGVVGAGAFAELWYLAILSRHPAVLLKAICSPSGSSAPQLARKYNVPATYHSYKEMLEEEDLDGICIVTPNESHFGIAVEAAKLGIHVMCEKPLAMDHNEARSMLEAAERNNIIHGVNFTYRENPGVKKMKELLAQGLIGKVYEGTFHI